MDCTQIVRSTSETGRMLFQIYVYPTAFVDEHYPIHHLDVDLTWPPSWQMVSYDACAGGSATLLDNGSVHPLHIVWPQCPQMTEQIFLAGRLVLDVDRYGKLDFATEPAPLWLGCPPEGFTSNAAVSFAEAGVVCDYTSNDCAYGPWCTPEFEETELALTAPAGGQAQGSLVLTSLWGYPSCPMVVTALDSWASGVVVPTEYPHYRLDVTADAHLLIPGAYETSVRVSVSDEWGRCAHVALEVTTTSGIGEEPPRGATNESWGRIKSAFR